MIPHWFVAALSIACNRKWIRVFNSFAARTNGTSPIRRPRVRSPDRAYSSGPPRECQGTPGIFPHAITEGDHVVELLVGKHFQVLRMAAAEVNAVLTHHPHRVGMYGLRVAAGAGGHDPRSGEPFQHRLSHLGAGTVARARNSTRMGVGTVARQDLAPAASELSGPVAGLGGAPRRPRPALRCTLLDRGCSTRRVCRPSSAASSPARRHAAGRDGRTSDSVVGRSARPTREPADRYGPAREQLPPHRVRRQAQDGGRHCQCLRGLDTGHPDRIHHMGLFDLPECALTACGPPQTRPGAGLVRG